MVKCETDWRSDPPAECDSGPRILAGRYLADDEEVLALHHLLLELLLEGHAHLLLILVHLGTVNVAVSKVNGNLHGLGHLARRGLQRKEYKP